MKTIEEVLPMLNDSEHAWLSRHVKENNWTVEDLCKDLREKKGLDVDPASLEEFLRKKGLKLSNSNAVVDTLIAKARGGGGVGEGEDHRKLKQFIANNPMAIGLSGFGKGDTEYCFPTTDRIDIVFRKHDGWVGVEVKGPSSPDEDLVRGLFQTVKYAALREAELKAKSQKGKTDVILVLSRKLPAKLKELKNLLGVTVVDGILAPEQDH